jgi:hypothetical protein
MSLPDLIVLPIPINLPASVESVPSLPAASDIVSSTFTLPEPAVSFTSQLTGAGLLLLREHRRLGHLHDRDLKRMIDCDICGNLVWIPGIVLRAHCLDCLKGQQKRNIPAPDPNVRELQLAILPDFSLGLVWSSALHGKLYWFLAVCPLGYHWGALSLPRNLILSLALHSCLRYIRGKVGDYRVRIAKFDGGAEYSTESAV